MKLMMLGNETLLSKTKESGFFMERIVHDSDK